MWHKTTFSQGENNFINNTYTASLLSESSKPEMQNSGF